MEPDPRDIIQQTVEDMVARMQAGAAGREEVFRELTSFSQMEQRMLLPHLMQALGMDTSHVGEMLSRSVSPAPVPGSFVEEDLPNVGGRGFEAGAEEMARERMVTSFSRNQLIAAGYPRWALFNELTGGSRTMEDVADLLQVDFNPISYRTPGLSSAFGSVPMEQYGTKRVDGELRLVRRRVRTTKGQLGRSLLTEEPQIRADLERAFRAALRENYRRLINTDRNVNTGVLLRSIEQGQLNVGGELDFDYTIANLPGEPRPGRDEQERRLSTHEYGPLVFQGRRSITSVNPMVFQSGGRWRKTLTVAPARPRPVLELTPEQIDRIDEILLRGINEDIEEWLTENEGVM